MEILCFYAGLAFFYYKSVYALCLLIIFFFFRPSVSLLFCFAAAFLWASVHSYWQRDIAMPKARVIKQATVQGYISSIPNQKKGKAQFQFRAYSLDGNPVQANMLLGCYQHCPRFHAGQTWQLKVKLKRPMNLGNPGHYDYENFLKARHVEWTGYIRSGGAVLLQDRPRHYPLLVLREKLGEQLLVISKNEKILAVIQALTIGLSNHIEKDEWDLFRRTGTIHLMVISGAHIGLVAGLVFTLVKWLCGFFPALCLSYTSARIASLASIAAALIYALLAGFAVPAQRALVVCFFMLLRNFCQQRFTSWQAWRYALLSVLLFEPHSVLMPGFYLSFLAVAVLLIANQRIQSNGLLKVILIQGACLLGLLPLSLYWFSYGAINGLVANLLAIPWVGFVVVPLSLLVMVLGFFFTIPGLDAILVQSIKGLFYFLSWVDSFALVNLEKQFSSVLLPIALMAALVLLLLVPLRSCIMVAGLLSIAAFFPSYKRPLAGEAFVQILDVGQGLSVVVLTQKHQLIYDTGMKFFQGSDMAKMAIIPYLSHIGVERLDKVIISHPDLDHRGGLASLQETYPISELLVDNPDFYKRALACHDYPDWTWDGVRFHFFPIPDVFKAKNNRSCVLRIETRGASVLLTGDIERQAEQYLLRQYSDNLRSDVLLVPHHGSKTSSSLPFLQAVSAKVAMISYGFDNRYHFPHPSTMRHFQQQKMKVYNTVDCGMIALHLKQAAGYQLTCAHAPPGN